MEDDYYTTVNAKWLRNTQLPSSHARYSEFDLILERNYRRIQDLMDLPSTPAILKTFYETAMQPKQTSIDVVKEYANSRDAVGLMALYGYPHLFGMSVSPDIKDSQNQVMYIEEPILSLPNKHYYLSTKYAKFLQQYKSYLRDSIRKFHLDIDADKVLATETRLASLCMDKENKRNIENIYNPMSWKQFNAHFDTTPILRVFRQNGITVALPSKVIVENVRLVKELKKMGDCSDYLKWRFYNSSFPYLNDTTEHHYLEFYAMALTGASDIKPKHTRVVNLMTNLLGDLLGYHYGKTYYTDDVKAKMLEIVKNIKRGMRDKIQSRSWMSTKTKRAALLKLKNMKYKLGYPATVDTYERLELTGSHFDHTRQLISYQLRNELDQIGRRPDTSGWEMGAHEVNAYYSLVLNEMVFPAGILQPPFFDINRSDESNYGAIGTIIGHEISHGFDDQGKKFNHEGELLNWWTKKDDKKYRREALKMVRQFDNIKEQGFQLNGKLTLGENLADLGGVSIALAALEKQYERVNYNKFFRAYASLWRQIIRKEEIARRVRSDPHSLGKFRVNQILKNIPQFIDTYQVMQHNGMYLEPKHRVNLWV
jgi:predicted metalloendopeptidase